ncbi:MAG: small ribosomal subunit biogenesis GTPase RsgA [Porticoccaceae bacterium]
MSKRNLTLQQQRRISEKRLRETIDPAEQLPADEQLGVEQIGAVYARYGQQADIINPEQPTAPPKRCYLRANLGSPVAGDRVVWRDGTPYGVVTALMPRHSVLERPDHNNQPRPVAANIDLVCVVIAPEPEPHGNLIDRFLVAARLHDLEAILVVNKTDLDTPHSDELDSLIELYRKLGYEVYPVSAKTGTGIPELTARLHDNYAILAGQSGVGKSSLINHLFPNIDARVGELSTQKRKGKHTTTASHLYLLPEGGGVIDSPGIREFGLGHLPSNNLIEGFVELRPLLGQCQFRDCSHTQEPRCAIIAALERGEVDPRRLASLRHMEQAVFTR